MDPNSDASFHKFTHTSADRKKAAARRKKAEGVVAKNTKSAPKGKGKGKAKGTRKAKGVTSTEYLKFGTGRRLAGHPLAGMTKADKTRARKHAATALKKAAAAELKEGMVTRMTVGLVRAL